MADNNIFEIAARKKYRFAYKGLITVEDLFDLSVEELDKIFKALNTQKKQANEESLLTTKTAEDEELLNKIEIVKYIVELKVSEANARTIAREKKAQKQKILSILADKQDAVLQNKSIEELQAMLENLE